LADRTIKEYINLLLYPRVKDVGFYLLMFILTINPFLYGYGKSFKYLLFSAISLFLVYLIWHKKKSINLQEFITFSFYYILSLVLVFIILFFVAIGFDQVLSLSAISLFIIYLLLLNAKYANLHQFINFLFYFFLLLLLVHIILFFVDIEKFNIYCRTPIGLSLNIFYSLLIINLYFAIVIPILKYIFKRPEIYLAIFSCGILMPIYSNFYKFGRLFFINWLQYGQLEFILAIMMWCLYILIKRKIEISLKEIIKYVLYYSLILLVASFCFIVPLHYNAYSALYLLKLLILKLTLLPFIIYILTVSLRYLLKKWKN